MNSSYTRFDHNSFRESSGELRFYIGILLTTIDRSLHGLFVTFIASCAYHLDAVLSRNLIKRIGGPNP